MVRIVCLLHACTAHVHLAAMQTWCAIGTHVPTILFMAKDLNAIFIILSFNSICWES